MGCNLHWSASSVSAIASVIFFGPLLLVKEKLKHFCFSIYNTGMNFPTKKELEQLFSISVR